MMLSITTTIASAKNGYSISYQNQTVNASKLFLRFLKHSQIITTIFHIQGSEVLIVKACFFYLSTKVLSFDKFSIFGIPFLH
jgi:hypothetical protein